MDSNPISYFDLYPHFERDAYGNIVARYFDGTTITIYYANRRADKHTNPNADTGTPVPAGQTGNVTDDGRRGESG